MTGYLYLASYPRSGNTLLRMLLSRCFGLKTVAQYPEDTRLLRCRHWEQIVGGQLWQTSQEYKRLARSLIDSQGVCPMKTHQHPPDDYTVDDPTIYVLRDGREVCVSYWRYYHDILEKRYCRLCDVILGEVLFGSWSAHLAAWYPQRRKNTLFLRYEDMVKRPAVIIGQLARFLDRVPTGHMPLTWEQVHQADPTFFRSGTNETWRELLTGDDLSLFWDLHGETMREYGYSEEACYANS